MNDLTFKINAQSENPTKTVVKARNFEFTIDEPKDLGGTNSGANPVEYLMGALSGCLNVVCHIIAKDMNINLKSLEINIEGVLNPEKLFGQETQKRAGFSQIQVSIHPTIEGKIEKAKLEEWLREVEQRCPVSDNIQHATPVNISLA